MDDQLLHSYSRIPSPSVGTLRNSATRNRKRARHPTVPRTFMSRLRQVVRYALRRAARTSRASGSRLSSANVGRSPVHSAQRPFFAPPHKVELCTPERGPHVHSFSVSFLPIAVRQACSPCCSLHSAPSEAQPHHGRSHDQPCTPCTPCTPCNPAPPAPPLPRRDGNQSAPLSQAISERK